MKLNALEKALMNNPVRAWVQRRVEAPLLESLGGRVGGLRALEVGCGRGVGTQIILDHFGAQEVWAFNLDEQMTVLRRFYLRGGKGRDGGSRDQRCQIRFVCPHRGAMRDFFGLIQLIALTVFLTVFIGRSLYMGLVKKINPFALGVGKRGIQRAVEVGFFFGFIAWALEIIASALQTGWRVFPGPLQWQVVYSMPLRIAGAVLVVAGIAIFALALVSFGTSWRVGIDEKAPGGLVTTGMFALSRNPIFLCLDLYAFGAFLLNGTLGFLIFALLLAVGVHYQILQEEGFLLRTYGRAYQRYYDRTARYFGWRSFNGAG